MGEYNTAYTGTKVNIYVTSFSFALYIHLTGMISAVPQTTAM